MHFSKFLTVSQIKENTKIITQQINKSSLQEQHYTVSEPTQEKPNQYHIRINPESTSKLFISQHQHHHSTLTTNPIRPRSKHRQGNPQTKVKSISPLNKESTPHSPILRKERRKYSQNNIQFNLRTNISTPIQHSQSYNCLKIPINQQIHNWPHHLQTTINPSQHPQKDKSNGKDKALISARGANTKSLWNQVSNFHLSVQSQNASPMAHLTKSQANSPKMQRKHSDNANTKKIPSFLTASKQYRKSFDCPNPTPSKLTISNFKIIRQLGRGAFGRVVLAQQRRSGMVCAIKIMAKQQIRKDNMVEQVLREVKIQMYLSHPNIAKVYGVFDDMFHFYILIECALDGQLSDFLRIKPTPLSENEASKWFYQACNAISTMHSSSIIHRDLKPENIMIHQGIIKVCDFGWSVIRGGQLRSTFCGTPLYLCPQLLLGDSYDESIDIWALGVILYEMLCKENPFRITRQQELKKIIESPIHFSETTNLSQQAKQIIKACLSKRAIDRPNIRQVLLDDFVLMGQQLDGIR